MLLMETTAIVRRPARTLIIMVVTFISLVSFSVHKTVLLDTANYSSSSSNNGVCVFYTAGIVLDGA